VPNWGGGFAARCAFRNPFRIANEGVYWLCAHEDFGCSFQRCRWFIRPVPAPPRDEVGTGDVNSRAEDHVNDVTRLVEILGGQSYEQLEHEGLS
jgi:hypothetical protein